MKLLKKFKQLFTGDKEAEKSVAVVGGPTPGKVDFKKLMQSAGRVTWPTMRGIKFAPVRRIYRKRPQLWIKDGYICKIESPGSKKISYSDARLHGIFASMKQGNEIAKQRRKDYVARRSAKWKKLVVEKLPQMFAQAMSAQGLGDLVGSGKAAGITPFEMGGGPGEIVKS